MTFVLVTLVFVGIACFAVYELNKRFNLKLRTALRELETKVVGLEESENKLKSIVEHMNEAVVAVDPDFKITFYNESFRRIFSPDYPIKDKRFFIDVVRNSHLTGLLQNVFQSRETEKKIIEISTPHLRRTTEVQAVYIPLQNQNLVALVFYDLTGIKETERMKRDFVANASHQLKTPLTAIQGYTEILLEDPDIELKMRQEFLKKIKAKSIEVAELVGKLLRLSKLEANAESVTPVSIDVLATIDRLEKKFEGNLKKHQIQIVHSFEDETLHFESDLSLLQLILENLFENAIKYSKPKGKVYISATRSNDEIHIRIRDEGIGIPQQDQVRIFERFFRSSNAESHSHDGIGIGMSLVKSALQKMRGTLEIHSNQNEGTEMFLKFPMVMNQKTDKNLPEHRWHDEKAEHLVQGKLNP